MLSNKWWDRPLTVIQTNLQVADTEKIDSERLIKQLKERFNADVLVFNAAGIYAWYPTKVPFHNINPFMGNRDILKEVIESAHKNGVKLIARTSIGHAEDWIYHQHPEWFIKDENNNPILIGEPRPGNWSLLYATCPNSPYQREEVNYKIYEEILINYDIDGFFITFIGFPKPCYCGYCRERYRREMGKDIPKPLSPGTSEWIEYLEWQKRCVVENFRDIVSIIRKHRRDILITGEFGGNSYTPYELIQLCDVLSPNITDRIGEGQPPRWMPTVQTRYALDVSNNTPPWMIVAPAPSLTWRHTTLPPNELRSWLSQIIVNKGNIWHALTGIPDTQKDERILELIEEISKKFDILRLYLEDTKLKANVAVLESRRNILMNQLPDRKNCYLDELYGFYDALTSGHIPFIPIPEEKLNIEILNDYKLLILPDSAYLTKEQIRVIKEFLSNGGTILGSYRTSLYDENGRELDDFALGEEFGIKFLKNEIKDTLASYMRIEERHPIFNDIGNTEMLPNGERFLQILPTKSKALLTYIPPFSSPEGVGAPPERASFRTLKTDIPLLVLNTDTRAMYFPVRIGALVWKLKMPEHRLLLINTIKWLLRDHLELYINAPSHVYVSLLQGRDFLLVNLANAIGERPLAEIIPVYNIDVKIKCKGRVKEIKSILNSRELSFQSIDEEISFIVPKLDYLESVVIKLE